MKWQQSKRKRIKVVASSSICLNPDKTRHTLRIAKRISAKQGSHIYPCGDHYHLTHKSRGAPT